MVDENDHVVEQFVVHPALSIGSKVSRDSVRPALLRGTGAASRRARSRPARDTGWVVKSQPVGFKKVMEMKRFKTGAQSPVAHLVYSDGLAAVSVFIEPLPTKRKFQEGLTHQGRSTSTTSRCRISW
jgi:sigma-E factor negative regulatory protein RseB